MTDPTGPGVDAEGNLLPSESIGRKQLARLKKVKQTIDLYADVPDGDLFSVFAEVEPRFYKEEHVLARELWVYRQVFVRKRSQVVVAMELHISPTTLNGIVTRIRDTIRIEVNKLDVAAYTADSLAAYNLATQVAFREMDSAASTPKERLQAVNSLARVKEAELKFLAVMGLFDGPAAKQEAAKVIGGGTDDSASHVADMIKRVREQGQQIRRLAADVIDVDEDGEVVEA